MQQPRKRRKWIENVAIFAIVIAACILALLAVIYVHENAPQWEVPAIFASLGLGIILPVLWYWRWRRWTPSGWIVSFFLILLGAFSFTSAIFHGWVNEAVIVFNLASVVIVALVVFNIARLSRRVESSLRAIGAEVNGDPLFRHETMFRDDGQRITVYPRRGRLLVNCIAIGAILAGLGLVFAFLQADAIWKWIVLGLSAGVFYLVFLATLYRLIVRRPSLVVGPDGIFDNGAFIWSGVGLIRWDEILNVYSVVRPAGLVKLRLLGILVTDLPAIRKRLPLLKRLALRNTYSGMSQVLIEQTMLEIPVFDLAAQIDQYVETHAPAGWHRRPEHAADTHSNEA